LSDAPRCCAHRLVRSAAGESLSAARSAPRATSGWRPPPPRYDAAHGPTRRLDSRDFQRIARAIAHIDAHWREQPTLAELARAAGLSRFHFSRLFRRWAGISPRQYLQHVTGAAAKARLRGRESVLDAALATGLSGPGRLHDLIVTLEAMSPRNTRMAARACASTAASHRRPSA
jgi:AraC-like DNA-binding protein